MSIYGVLKYILNSTPAFHEEPPSPSQALNPEVPEALQNADKVNPQEPLLQGYETQLQ